MAPLNSVKVAKGESVNLIDVIVSDSTLEKAKSDVGFLSSFVTLIKNSIRESMQLDFDAEHKLVWGECTGPFGWDANGKSLSGFCKEMGQDEAVIVTPELILDHLRDKQTDSLCEAAEDMKIVTQPKRESSKLLVSEFTRYSTNFTKDGRWRVKVAFTTSASIFKVYLKVISYFSQAVPRSSIARAGSLNNQKKSH